MSEYPNFSIFVEKQLQLEYQEGAISNGGEYWLQINCANNQNIQVRKYSLRVFIKRFGLALQMSSICSRTFLKLKYIKIRIFLFFNLFYNALQCSRCVLVKGIIFGIMIHLAQKRQKIDQWALEIFYEIKYF